MCCVSAAPTIIDCQVYHIATMAYVSVTNPYTITYLAIAITKEEKHLEV